ncbi:hypothetical protein A2U01_0027829, partial [Trifolium medium]|nr:hypothetical protein [Trifolium medium]
MNKQKNIIQEFILDKLNKSKQAYETLNTNMSKGQDIGFSEDTSERKSESEISESESLMESEPTTSESEDLNQSEPRTSKFKVLRKSRPEKSSAKVQEKRKFLITNPPGLTRMR